MDFKENADHIYPDNEIILSGITFSTHSILCETINLGIVGSHQYLTHLIKDSSVRLVIHACHICP